MEANEKSFAPDFQVQWQNGSGKSAGDIYCARPLEAQQQVSFFRALGILSTPTTHIVVTELNWAEPTALEFTPHRPGFTALVSSSSLIEYGYNSEASRAGQLGLVLLMLPGKTLRSHQTAGTARAITCSFEPTYAETVLGRPLEALSVAQASRALDVRSSLISAILLRLMHEALYPGPLQTTVAESFGHALLVECAHWLAVDSTASVASGRLTARHLTIIEELLGKSSGAPPSVAELSAACGFSERYFAKLFREQMQCSIGQYIKSVHITKAKTYLLETDLPLKEIAYRLGFSTPANFSSAFRLATGCSPGQFRQAK